MSNGRLLAVVTSDIMSDMDGFGQRLRELRRQAGLSQEALAAKAHLSHRTIARLEAGAPRPHRSTLALIAQALKVDLTVLEDGEAA